MAPTPASTSVVTQPDQFSGAPLHKSWRDQREGCSHAVGSGDVREVSIDLRCCDVSDLLRELPPASAHFIHADPPWRYDTKASMQGKPEGLYPCLSMDEMIEHLRLAHAVARPNTYMALWCPFPKLMEWAEHSNRMEREGLWEYLSGGCWGKPDRRGIGWHMRGDAEPFFLYRKGEPHPTREYHSSWCAEARREGHSVKTARVLVPLVLLATRPGDLVVDLYAGSGSLARVCRALGRRYVGAEISEERHARALRALQMPQQSMFGELGLDAWGETDALTAIVSGERL